MRQKTELKVLTILVVLLFGLILLVGCTKKIVGHQEVGVRIEIPIEGFISPKLAARIDHFVVLVEAPDLAERIIEGLFVQDGVVTGEIEVPSGPHRLFTVMAIDTITGVTIYQGSDVVDVFAGHTIVLDIQLFPMAPILSISPHYQIIQMDSTFTLDFYLHNVTNIGSINFDLDVLSDGIYKYGPFESFPISGSPGDGIDTNLTTFGYGNSEGGGISVWLYSRNEVGDVTSPTGTTHLGSLTFSSYADWGDTASSIFSLNVYWIYSPQDTTQTAASIYTDQAEVLLWKPPGGGK